MALLGCSLIAPPKRQFSAPPLEKVFPESFDNVWKAMQLATTKYPMKVADYDSGIYETQPIRGERAWTSPHNDKKAITSALRYIISIRLMKGKDAQGKAATRVIILKQAEVQKDFFSDYEKQPSDGLEEKSLMYRIDREIQIAKALSKVNKD